MSRINPGEFLETIIKKKKQRLVNPDEEPACASDRVSEKGKFRNSLAGPGVSVIAEIKKASPSKGLIRPDLNPVEIAKAYKQGGASAISVLTEQDFFLGSPEILQNVRSAVDLPVLRKDFIIDRTQLGGSAAMGAHAVLLIVAVLGDKTGEFIRAANDLGLDTLVEVHDGDELDIALAAGADIIGVNNRNLKTFEVRFETSLELAESIPDSLISVSESGISNSDQLRQLERVGFNAVLVGEHFMRSDDIVVALESIMP